MKFEILEKILVDAGLGTPGVNLFTHFMPAEVNQGILMRGPLQGIPIDCELPDYYKADIQVIVRAQKQVAGAALAKQVSDVLTHHQVKTYTLDGTELQIKQMYPKALPIVYPRSDGNALEWSLHFDTVYVMTE